MIHNDILSLIRFPEDYNSCINNISRATRERVSKAGFFLRSHDFRGRMRTTSRDAIKVGKSHRGSAHLFLITFVRMHIVDAEIIQLESINSIPLNARPSTVIIVHVISVMMQKTQYISNRR